MRSLASHTNYNLFKNHGGDDSKIPCCAAGRQPLLGAMGEKVAIRYLVLYRMIIPDRHFFTPLNYLYSCHFEAIARNLTITGRSF